MAIDEFACWTIYKLFVATNKEKLTVCCPLPLVNKGPPQLLSIETLPKLATEPFLTPDPPLPHLSTFYYLEPRGSPLPWIRVVMATNNYALVQEAEEDKCEGRAGQIKGLGGSVASACWRSSCDKSQDRMFNDTWRSGRNLRGT